MALIVILLLPNVYMLEPCMAVRYGGTNAWLVKLLGGMIVLAMIWLKIRYYAAFLAFSEENRAAEFRHFVASLLGKGGAAIFFAVWSLIFFIQAAIMLRQLSDNIITMALPSAETGLMVFFLAAAVYLLSLYGLEILLRCAYLFFALSAVGIVALFVGLATDFTPLELLPWQGGGIKNTLRAALLDSGTWLGGVAVFAVARNMQQTNVLECAVKKGFFYVMGLKSLLLAGMVMLFGSVVAGDRMQLFYEAVRTLHFSQYIQRLDGIFIFIWLTGGILSVAVCAYFATAFWAEAFFLPDIRPLLPLGVLSAASLAVLPQGMAAIFKLSELFLYEASSMILLADFLVISGGYFLYKRRRRKWQQ
jgi:hypothetical protein